ncbi:adenine nucleotide alpha hydrolases-like protein [Daldinia decipiens]|uniref:adenine nucleotide alpha hydrolases-like protein n=1 Tax=Daldinia decipiens TaxID=326647 RepID=UPI0020C34DEB|nr:adenine nucleotide alpha hydrolases-like protein [Daldinia decipiens]KAI1660244.1 adenine nucleotide alpha hydrolases-like protein [Daldinia decipiens]
MAADRPLHVVALVSGGKDSFYSILHCLANGHRVVALANLHPPPRVTNASRCSYSRDANTSGSIGRTEAEEVTGADAGSTATTTATIRISPGVDQQHPQHPSCPTSCSAPEIDHGGDEQEDEADLNSFMYQTVGHQVIPLYAQATGLPLFRRSILGTAVDHGISYQEPGGHREDEDETESLVPLLRAVLEAHPDVNALCTGAILSTYQRTRVESVALRLGLVPLAYLWQFPELPLPFAAKDSQAAGTDRSDDAQLLRDMAAARLEARIVKVASAGLGEEFLWENVASESAVFRIRRALRRFGGDGGRGAVLGEGGEFETLVVDGPSVLFKGRVMVDEDDKRIVREGGGSAWLSIRKAKVEMKSDLDASSQTDGYGVRIPDLLDLEFKTVLESLHNEGKLGYDHSGLSQTLLSPASSLSRYKHTESGSNDWYFVGNPGGIEDQTASVVDEVRRRLGEHALPSTAIVSSVIVLRRMADFSTVNKLYGALFREPNPPARVTISCGDSMLPRSADIVVLLTVQRHLKRNERRGLHVQSRSYWAPANIGPYSQAVTYPLLRSDEGQNNDAQNSELLLAVSIAGQIPLVPASMTLPPIPKDGSSSLALQITLALQHLWRVGGEMKVQWWSGAVAYFPRSALRSEARHSALLASAAWNAAHVASSSLSTDAVEEPDPWDRRYNPAYMIYGNSSDDTASRPSLPDWEVLRDFDAGADADADADAEDGNIPHRPLPFVFSAEVEELPRSAGVEWHAHLGFANVDAGSIRLYVAGGGGTPEDPLLHHVVVESPSGDVFAQTAAICQAIEGPISALPLTNAVDFENIVDHYAVVVKRSLLKLLEGSEPDDSVVVVVPTPKFTYVDPESFKFPEHIGAWLSKGAIIPCRSLWDPQGRRLNMVSIFETRWCKVR